ncbi:MAG: hypothetical protein CBC22_03930 [Alphaproteobacteria bacterium TMED62]|nr:MAG: hypothetical protein CBC22_03930 [Alphaproteobacteria bacterium TMED62]|tara:strand:- start:1101 stop:1976 length:876 start_codon:yes stop_codon:yes gene_type:complete
MCKTINIKVIIFGASGFIGKALCKELKARNIEIVALASSDLDLLKINKNHKLLTTMDKNTSIVFMSTIIPSKNENNFKKNVSIINNFISLIKDKQFNHIIYLSSDAVYKDSLSKINENSDKNEVDLYAKMHLVREDIIKEYCNKNDISFSILRPTAVFGPGATHYSYGPNKFIKAINAGEKISLFGKGEEGRDYIFIYDLVKIIADIIEKKILGIFTLASGKVYTFHQVAKLICNIQKISFSRIEFIKRNKIKTYSKYRSFDISKLKKNISSLDFTDLKKAIEWSIKNNFR